MAQVKRTRTGDVFKIATRMRELGIEELEVFEKYKIKLGNKPLLYVVPIFFCRENDATFDGATEL